MASEIPVELIPFSFDEIEEKVKEALLANGLTDILYPGSNISQIADIMTYLVHVLNTNTAINLQEVILPLATKRMNVLFGGRQLGYEAVQRTSWRYKLNITLKRREFSETLDENGDPLPISDFDVYKLIIPKYTIFESNGHKYYYMGDEISILNITNNNRFDKDFSIEVKEGDLISYEDNDLLSVRAFTEIENNIPKTKQNYLIPFNNVEDDGIETWLTYVDDNGEIIKKQPWSKYNQFLVDSSYDVARSKFVRLQNIFLQMPSIFFEVGGYGNPIRINTLIQSNVLISKGADGKSGEEFTVQNSILSDQINVSLSEVTHQGTEIESIESIKENAPVFHNSANRAVTALDYVSITQRHENVKWTKCWGSEEEFTDAKVSATILFSFFPERTVRSFLSTSLNSDSNAVNEEDLANLQFDLQTMPRHPIFPFVKNPNEDTVEKPEGWKPRPVNYLEQPEGWNTFAPGNVIPNPPEEVKNPGQKPLISYPEERNQWMLAQIPELPKIPGDWIENPNITTIPTAGLEIIQDATYIALQAEYIQGLANASTFITNDKNWYTSTSNYGGSENGAGDAYKTWLAQPATILFITWEKEDFLYRQYLEQLAKYESDLSEYNNYVSYLGSTLGEEYTSYYNALIDGGSLPGCDSLQTEKTLTQCSDIRYNNFLDDVELYNVNREAIDNLKDNWYLKRNETYIAPDTPTGESDSSIFSELEPYKIMTMNHENRQPVYINFDYIVKVIKYDLSKTASDTNQLIFDVINEYFKNHVERLDFNYYASNLQRRIDEVLGDNSGIELALENYVSISSHMYDAFSMILNGGTNNRIITKLAFPYEKLYTDGFYFDGNKFLPKIDTDGFVLGRTKYELELHSFAFSDGESSGVISIKTTNVIRRYMGGDIYEYYKALTDIDDIDLNEENFYDTTKWLPLNDIVDIIADDTIRVFAAGYGAGDSTGDSYYYSNTFKNNINLQSEDFTTGIWENTHSSMTGVLRPQSLYCLTNVDGSYKTSVDFNKSDDVDELNIYLGDSIPAFGDGPGTDMVVGKYLIRNERSQLIEVHLNFESKNGDGFLTGVGGIPEFLCFTDYGFGYFHVVYPSNIDSNSDNIPFTENTMPRLRQVKFDIQ